MSKMLRVAIIGAGIAGLSASIALRRAGHMVTIYEQSLLSRELGAAINVPPNASRPLLSWGLDPIGRKFVRSEGISFCSPSDLQPYLFIPMGDVSQKAYGAPHYFAHRVDLHQALRDLATGQGLGEKVIIKLGMRAISFDCETPLVTFSNGDTVGADVVICADGIHSQGVQSVSGSIEPPQLQEPLNTCCRFLISAESLHADPETAWFLENAEGKLRLFIDKDAHRRIVCYPCRNNEILNFVMMFHDPSPPVESKEDWQEDMSKAELVKEFSSYPEKFIRIINKAADIKRYPLLARDPLHTWIKGRTALAGDAAHPMLPHQGQGGAMAVEDGVALGIALAHAAPEQIPARLAIYEQLRRRRASAMQILSLVSQEEVSLVAKRAEPFFEGKPVPTNPQDFGAFNFGYDVVTESLKAVQAVEPSFSLPVGMFE